MRRLALTLICFGLVACGEPEVVYVPTLPPPPTAAPGQPPPPNGQPTLVIHSHPDPPQGTRVVYWNLCSSSDPEDDLLTYIINFDQDQKQFMSGHCDTTFRYTAGVHQTQLCVWDRDPRHEFVCQTIAVHTN